MKNSEKLKSKKNAKAIPDNATTGEQHAGRQRSDSAEPDTIGFPKSNVSHETIENPLQLFHRNSYKISVDCFRETRRGGLVRPASKSCRFSHHPLRVPKAWHRGFAACGQRSGLLALNLASIFEKLLDQKTFQLPAARIFEQSVFIKAIVSHETLHKNCTCFNETGAMNNS